MTKESSNSISFHKLLTNEIHNDSTTVTFIGIYKNSDSDAVKLKHKKRYLPFAYTSSLAVCRASRIYARGCMAIHVALPAAINSPLSEKIADPPNSLRPSFPIGHPMVTQF